MARSLRGPCFFAFWGAWGRGMRIATASVRTGFAMTWFLQGVRCAAGHMGPALQRGNKRCSTAGRCGERTERCQWQKQRSERVAAVKISSVRRKAAQKFWAPQQGHRPLRKRILWCVGEGLCPSRGRPQGSPLRRVIRGAVGWDDVGTVPYGGETEIHLLSGGRGRTPPLRRVTRGAVRRDDVVGSGPYGCATRGAGKMADL